MATKLRCLLVEDSKSDSGLIVRALRKSAYEVTYKRVENDGQMRAALEEQAWDAVIADYRLPEFSGPAALAVLKETGLDLPFIVISGVISGQAAVEIMKAGAHDYLMKRDLARLGPVMARELREAESRRERHQTEEALRESEERFRSVVENAPDAICVTVQGRIRYVNPAALRLFGAESDLEILNQPVLERVHPESRAAVADRMRQVYESRVTEPPSAQTYLKLDGTAFKAEVTAVRYTYEGENAALILCRDITERLRHDAEKEALLKLLGLCNAPTSQHDLIRAVTSFLQTWSGCEAVGVRLSEGYDFPYFETRGFPPEFVKAESQLCSRDSEGELLRDSQGNPVLECMCGNVICGRFDPRLPFFTENGSFWTNCTSELLASTTEADRQSRTRNRCNGEGYESVALVRLAFAGRSIGLLQFNDKRKGRFNPGLLEFLERVAASLATALEERFAHAAMRESEERYRSLFENMREGYAYCRMEFRHGEPQDFLYLAVNEAFETLTGLKGAVGRWVSEVIPGLRESNPELFEIYGRVSLTGRPETFETYVASMGIWFSVSAYAAGKGHFVSVFDNITGRKRAEEKLRASEERYRLIAENTSDVIWSLDVASGRITYVSPSVIWLRGYSPEEVLAQSLEDMMTPESYRHATARLAERTAALESGDESARTAVAELENTCRDGSIATTETVVTLLTDEAGHVSGIVGVSRDITKRKRAELALRESEERALLLADMLEHSSQPFVTSYLDGRIGVANAAFCDLVGHSQEELRSLDWAADLTPADWLEVDAARRAEVCHADMPMRWEQELIRRSGWRIPVELLVHLVRDSAGAPSYYYAFITDLTERKRAEAQLRESKETIAQHLSELEAIYAGAPVGLCVFDSDLRILRLNERLAEINGLPAAAHLGRTISEILPDVSKLVEPMLRSVLETGEPVVGVEIHGATPAQPGLERDWLASYYPIQDGARVVGINAVIQEITDLKRAQQALQESEQRYRELFENSQLGIYRTTPDGRILLANPTLLALLGYSSLEEIAERNLEDGNFFSGYDRAWFKQTIEREGTIRNHAGSWRRRDGKTVQVQENAKVVRDPQGAVLYYDGTVEDVTERRLVQEALRESEERFRQVAEDADVFVWEVDADGLYTYASSVVETILGYTPDELIGKLHYYDLFAPDDRETLRTIATEAFAQQRSFFAFLNRNVRKDGAIVILETNGTPLRDTAGNFVGYRGTDRDVTDRARATDELRQYRDHLEELVRERTAELEEKHASLADEVLGRTLAVEAYSRSEARLQLQFHSMPSACITLGPDLRIRSWNPAAELVFGYAQKEAMGAAVLDLLVPEDTRPEILALFEKTFSGEQTLNNVNENLTKDGRRIICEWTNTRMASPDGASVSILCMAQDITARKQAEEALRRKTEELEAFNKAMIGRESRVIELKEEVNRHCAELGRPPAYPPVWSRDKE